MVSSMRTVTACSVLLVSLMMSGCALPYYWQAAAGQLELLASRVRIVDVLDDPEQTDATREALARAVEIRDFAVVELGLPDNDSYRTYADLGRAYVVWNVVATEEFSVDARSWCFPIAGCVTYRGYFDQENAEAFAADLGAQGLDTYVAGTTAYSTLGYFSDPLLNTMLAGGEPYLASVIFHELAHQLAYIKGATALNEAFASAVAEFGTLEWLMQTADSQAVEEHRNRLRRREDFFDLIVNQQSRLRELYESTNSLEAKRNEKREAFQRLVTDYEALRSSWGGASDYDDWFARPLNNAQLASVVAYSRWLPNLRAYLHAYGLETLYAEMTHLAELNEPQREARLEAFLTAAVSSETR